MSTKILVLRQYLLRNRLCPVYINANRKIILFVLCTADFWERLRHINLHSFLKS